MREIETMIYKIRIFNFTRHNACAVSSLQPNNVAGSSFLVFWAKMASRRPAKSFLAQRAAEMDLPPAVLAAMLGLSPEEQREGAEGARAGDEGDSQAVTREEA
jgi:hypothetical protein